MRSALYYPHTTVKSEQLLKTALLLWDELYVIAPWTGYTPDYHLPHAAEAFSIIGKCHHPSEDERRHAHELVEDFVTRPLPAAFSYSSVGDPDDAYEMYTQKLLPKTWMMLQRLGMTARDTKTHARASRSTGLSLMNIIADCCAGNTLARVTDQGSAYASLAGLLMERPDPELAITQAREQVIPVPIKIVDLGGLSLKALVDLRKREQASSEGAHIRDLRHRFVDKIEEQARRLVAADSTLGRKAIEQEFEAKMRDDYENLRHALKAKVWQTLGTKELLTALIAGVGSIATAVFAPTLAIAGVASATEGVVSIGGLLSTGSKFAEERRKTLLEHPTAYLYEAVGGLRW